ncbi:tripartite tricarboxylate transporter substrate binding protein [Pigmentiphaga sp.]|uniref:Bug family tripartite tricarboxylate transporter substrate binding protein n=1 Tax=Pigmentiphaga sp. TaxID=1977564 RepID=UPI00128D6492|nr:tripartite tricarboxylate transporter substrate binding protein [Pigmentiphaga sp.]MPS30563.1 tripartite tricarboxylate transporter substrate binding protein [Alcaligenaceae bacterium SAGV5]MPS50092.1 tripartite tricarboxylate transporter substrate binding protein [Alcaligenaceae bacterium SAGV3]MPT60516.1 tripartite tricarboxylate transporter substrate binding protein [Alcaligenaceae bacterium]
MKTLATLAMLALALPGYAHAADKYPSKPVRVIVPYVAGGAADITTRVIAQKLSDRLGASFIVENKPGANGMIGTDFVAKAKPDGYTLLADASGPLVVNPSLYEKVPYDPVKDLVPVSQLTSYQYALVVPAASPLRSLDDLVRTARTQPGKLSYGSAGIGAGGHLAGELLALMSKSDLTHVPYKGNAQALADILGGQLSFTFDTIVTAVPHIRSGKLRAFAVSGPARSPALPDVPTMEELGYKGFHITQFQGILAPAGTDAAIVKTLNDAVRAAMREPDVVKRLADEGGYEIVAGSPADFAGLITTELDMYRRLIQDANIRMQ